MRARPWPIRLLFGTAFAVVLVALVVEVVLQGLAFSVWIQNRGGEAQARTAAGNRVLCVGDSNTYGIGASHREFSYPSQLQDYLNETQSGGTWEVVNGGWSGRNSAEVMQRLPDQIAEFQPDVVCILAGINNRWSDKEMNLERPTPGSSLLAEDPTAWRWYWRTGRLAKILSMNLQARGTLAHEAPESETSTRTKRKDPSRAVGPNDRNLWLPLFEAAPLAEGREDLRLASAEQDRASRRRRNEELRTFIQEAGRLVGANKPEEAKAHLANLPKPLDAIEDAVALEIFLRTLLTMGLYSEILEAAPVIEASIGRTGPTCRYVGKAHMRLGDLEAALDWVTDSLCCKPWDPENYEALSLVHRTAGRPREAFQASILGFCLTGELEVLKTEARRSSVTNLISHEQLAEILAPLPINVQQQEQVVSVYDDLLISGQSSSRLEQDLAHMVKLCREAQLQPVILTYPRSHSPWRLECCRILRLVAEEQQVPLVDLEQVFLAELKTQSVEILFQPDGHPKDPGYAIVAREVGNQIREVLPSLSGQ